MFCVYCGREMPDTEASDEHVLPRAIGGNVTPRNPFLLRDVCRRCNSAAGRHIDLPFIKSWFTSILRASHSDRFVDLAQNPTLPLMYGGRLQVDLGTDKIGELWIGPSGDSIYFFHDPYPDAVPGAVGPPLNLGGVAIDPGFVFIFVAATNPDWQRVTVHSMIDYFDDAVFYLGNGPTPPGGAFSDIPPRLHDLQDRLRNLQGTPHPVEIPLAPDLGHRFLAKFALGIGALTLDPDFVRSAEAVTLRSAMWERDRAARARIAIHGRDFLSGDASLRRALGWTGGHVVVVKPIRRALLVIPIFYGQLSAAIQITETPEYWRGRVSDDGDAYLVAPGLRRYVGPVPLAEYIGARMLGPTGGGPALNAFLRAVESVPLPPPFQLMEPEAAVREQIDSMKRRLRETAYELWEQRGRPWGDPLADWLEAKAMLGVATHPKL